MAENTQIEWCDATFNPWIGCTKVSPGCDHCYAEVSTPSRVQKISWGPGAPRRRTSVANWRKPLAWNAAHAKFFAEHGRRQRVFCASLADVFDNEVSAQWRMDLMRLIEKTPNLDWLLLTKRIGNAADMLETAVRGINHGRWGWTDNVFPNVWIGATIVNQEEADRDIPKLLSTPAAVRFLSMEPLLGPVHLDQFHPSRAPADPTLLDGIDWIIVGGESGPKARPMHPDWPRSLRDQCAAANVPFLFKQHGEWVSLSERAFGTSHARHVILLRPDGSEVDPQSPEGRDENTDVTTMANVGKKAAGRLLDGVQHDGYPNPIKVVTEVNNE